MNITGEMLIGSQSCKGSGPAITAQNPVTGDTLEPVFYSSVEDDIQQACELAERAFNPYRSLPYSQRAEFLVCIGEEILALGDTLVQRAVCETGLPQQRIEGERARTIGQLNLFAEVVRSGHWMGVRIDSALPEREPLPRADIRLRHIPLGPVAVFGASNFPLAFSVAGGDTASALAAGCPVIVKAHPAHPGTSELVGRAIITAAQKCDMPEGVFSLLFDGGIEVGSSLVRHPAIQAVGFTGSRSGGMALMNIAANRPVPIPVYAEMSSINPVFLFPSKLKQEAQGLASGFVNSLTMGAGQFCTNPGLVIAAKGPVLDEFTEHMSQQLAEIDAQTMLTCGIFDAYVNGVSTLSENKAVTMIATGKKSDLPNRCVAQVYKVSATSFLQDKSLENEVFGSASLIVECQTFEEMLLVAESLEGQLTATMQMNSNDIDLAQQLLPVLERKVGRILCNGYPTGVEVCHAMVHGGPFPATSDSRTTSVGSRSIDRFLRPVSYQNMPEELLPVELADQNKLNLNRLVDGKFHL